MMESVKWFFGQGAFSKLSPIESKNDRDAENIRTLCKLIKADDVHDLHHILCSMVLSECVYKMDTREMVEALNTFKLDFGAELVNIKQVQPCLSHVPHRYLLAVSHDTLYAAFIGTKQYWDYITNLKILQEAIFQEDISDDILPSNDDKLGFPEDTSRLSRKSHRRAYKPAAHQGFLARSKRIPAMEIYMLAQQRNQKLILCGHSLGGAIAVLTTLSILRSISLTLPKSDAAMFIRCITFSQPPVGNTALRDLVYSNGWHQHFRTFCIPEDVVPRLLSPSYFQQYVDQLSKGNLSSPPFEAHSPNVAVKPANETRVSTSKRASNHGEQTVLGGHVQKYFNRLSHLVPITGGQKQVEGQNKSKDRVSSSAESMSNLKDISSEQTIQIQGKMDASHSDVRSHTERRITSPMVVEDKKTNSRQAVNGEHSQSWRPLQLPIYVPFGKLLLLEDLSVELSPSSDFSTLNSVGYLFSEFKERFPSHSMKSYRFRIQRIYEHCMKKPCSPASVHLPVQQIISNKLADKTNFEGIGVGMIVESHTIQTATSIVPLGRNGGLREKIQYENMTVDVFGYGLQRCSLIQAQVNGNWFSATVDAHFFPQLQITFSDPKLQSIRMHIGSPIKESPLKRVDSIDTDTNDSLSDVSNGYGVNNRNSMPALQDGACNESVGFHGEAFRNVIIHCSSDFVTATKNVNLRTRRVRLLGLEGAGKTSLYNALLGMGMASASGFQSILPDSNYQEEYTRGICIIDSPGVNLQDLHGEVMKLRKELRVKSGQINKKIDLVILVHNISHKLPCLYKHDASSCPRAALSLLIDEVDAAGIPWILAITNKYAVSAHRIKPAIDEVLRMYRVPSSMFAVLNTCDYVSHGSGIDPQSLNVGKFTSKELNGSNRLQCAVQKIISGFRKRAVILPVEGVNDLWSIIYNVLTSREDHAFQELATEMLSIEKFQDQNKLGSKGMSVNLNAIIQASFRMVKEAVSAFKKPRN